MSANHPLLHDLALLPTGTAEFKRTPTSDARKWVYQRTAIGFGNLGQRGQHDLQIRRHVIPRDPRTLKQILRRARMRAAVSAWHELDTTERAAWKLRGSVRKLPAFNAFVSWFLLTAPPEIDAFSDQLRAAGLRLTAAVSAFASSALKPDLLRPSMLHADASAPAGGSLGGAKSSTAQATAKAYRIYFGTTLYINTKADSGAAMPWGIDVWKVGQKPSAGVDTSTQIQQGALSSNQVRTVAPYLTKTANESAGTCGWCIDPAEMLSTSFGKRRIVAGNHVLNVRITNSNILDGATYKGKLNAYRIGAGPARTVSLIGSADWSVTLSLGAGTLVATLALPQITFEADESIQYEVVWNATAVTILANTLIFNTGLSTGTGATQARITFPGLSTYYP